LCQQCHVSMERQRSSTGCTRPGMHHSTAAAAGALLLAVS
jgi:hypothetical protein